MRPTALQRAKIGDNIATIRWEGVLADAKGKEDKWLGVQWDKPELGRHDGVYQGKKLFDVTVPNSGAFVRAALAKRAQSLASIARERYSPSSPRLSLDGSLVGYIDVSEELPFRDNVEILNLSSTLIGDFSSMCDAVDLFPKLTTLVLGYVHFVDCSPPGRCVSIQDLAVPYTNIGDAEIRALSSVISGLLSLDVSFTKIKHGDFTSFGGLEELHAEGLNLATIQTPATLLRLFLSRNAFTEVPRIPAKGLSILVMKQNLLKSVFALDAIFELPKLTELEIQRNPIQEELGEVKARLLVLARFPQLKILNRSPVSQEEPTDSAILYLNTFANDDRSRHPRWQELVEAFGPPAEVSGPAKPTKFTILIERHSESHSLDFSPTVRVGLLARKVARIFGLQDGRFELVMVNGAYETVLAFPQQTLGEVGCGDQSKILVIDKGDFATEEQARCLKIRSIAEGITNPDS